jgi:hypothetical protein
MIRSLINSPVRYVIRLLGTILLIPLTTHATTNATANGQWISLGVPTNVYMGTTGSFYLTGDDMGSCGSTTPNYVRVDTSQSHWKDFYALILFAAANRSYVVCDINSGCGSAELWTGYCRVSPQ